ncbi:MAG TPA: S1 family peptidase [Longimicrobiaceae bacterium]|nr:S1 family peptidase [Longimicrobiaceae bacterium]
MRNPRLAPVSLLLAMTVLAAGCERAPFESAAAPEAPSPSRQAETALSAQDALLEDARSYAADQEVSIREALRRLELQREIGELNARLEAGEPATFAGLYIEHSPGFRVVARFTSDGERTLQRYVAGGPLAGIAQAEPAGVPLMQLQARLIASHRAMQRAGIPADGGLDLRANRAEVYVRPASVGAARGVLARAGNPAEVVAVDHLARPEHGDDLHGGLHLTTCTSGFTVQNSSGSRGITTSAHCGNTQSHEGRSLNFLSEREGGSYDIQWHNRSRAVFLNTFWDGSTHRTVTATRSRSNQAVGNYVCKYGMTTGYTCGYIETTSYCYDGACTWIRVGRDGYNLSESGDSGGPWFNGGTAYGSHTLGIGDDAAYMAVNYFSGISVTVVTS